MCPTSQIAIRQMLGLADGSMNLALESIPPHLPMCLCHSQHCGSLEDCGYPAVLMKHIVTSLPRHRWATIPGSSSWPWLITMWSHKITLKELEPFLYSWILKHSTLCCFTPPTPQMQMNDANIQILLQIELEMHILCTHVLVRHKCRVKASRIWTLRLFKCLLSRCSQTDRLIETFTAEKKISECRRVSSAKRESCKFLLGPQTL